MPKKRYGNDNIDQNAYKISNTLRVSAIINLQEATNRFANVFKSRILPKMKGKIRKVVPHRKHIKRFNKRVEKDYPHIDQERVRTVSPYFSLYQVKVKRRDKRRN